MESVYQATSSKIVPPILTETFVTLRSTRRIPSASAQMSTFAGYMSKSTRRGSLRGSHRRTRLRPRNCLTFRALSTGTRTTTAILLISGTATQAGRFTPSQHGDCQTATHHYRQASPILRRHRPQGLRFHSLPRRPGEHSRTVSAGALGMAQPEQALPQLTPTLQQDHTLWFLRSRIAVRLSRRPRRSRP